MQIELTKVKQELDELKKMNYLNWSGDEIIDWISSLDDGQYVCYAAKLRKLFAKEHVDGRAIPHIDKTELKNWGIEHFMHRANIYNHFQTLLNRNVVNVNNSNNIDNNNVSNDDLEGKNAPTSFIG